MGDEAVIWTGLDALPVSVDIFDGLLHVTFDVESETGGLWDGETEVESDDTGDTSETDEETPTVVDGFGAARRLGKDGALVGGDDDESYKRGGCQKVESISWHSF